MLSVDVLAACVPSQSVIGVLIIVVVFLVFSIFVIRVILQNEETKGVLPKVRGRLLGMHAVLGFA